MSEKSMPVTDRLVRRAASAMTRRRLLRNSGAGALSLALGGALVSRRADPAFARGTASHPCGPSPYCPSGRCYNGQCSNAAGRYYDTYTCNPNNLGGCWTEDYRNVGAGYWKCCDCCAWDGGGATCSGCSSRRACICRKRIG